MHLYVLSYAIVCVHGVCMCIYMYVCAHVCMVYICVPAYVCTCVYGVCVPAYVCVHVYMEYEGGAYASVHECVCMCANQRLMLCALFYLSH